MGILFISITVGVVLVAMFLIMYLRKNKTIDKPGGAGDPPSVVEKKTGEEKGIYD